MKGFRSAALTLPIFLVGCTVAAMAGDTKMYQPSEVVGRQDLLKGRRIYIRGYLVLRDEAHGLWDSKDDFDRAQKLPSSTVSAPPRCISVGYNENGAKGIGRNHPRVLTAFGKISVVDREHTMDIGACSDAYINIERVVPDSRLSRH